jgi:hypothetical protein
MAAARRVSLFEREIRIRPSTAAIEILFDVASVLSEGHVEADGYFGSTMITIDLARAAPLVSDTCDAATARRLTELLAADERARKRAFAIAAAEAQSRAEAALGPPRIDWRVRASGVHVQIDLDVEAMVGATGAPAARSRG